MFKSVTNPFFETNFSKLMDESKLMGGFKMPNFDMAAMMDMQRKNVEMLTALNQTALENLQTFTQNQMDLMRQGFEKTTSLLSGALSSQKSETQEDGTRQAGTSKISE